MPTIDRRDTDSHRAYQALCDYCALGAHRSIDKLLQHYASPSIEKPPTTARGTLGYWSKKHDFPSRASAYDAAVQVEESAARAALRAERRAALEDADWEQGGMVRQRVTELLLEMPKFLRRTISHIEKDGNITEVITLALSAGPGELARALKLASELQRLSVGIATDIHEVSGPNGGPLQTEIVYSYETAIAGIAGRSGEDRDSPSENASAGDGPTLGQIYDGRGD